MNACIRWPEPKGKFKVGFSHFRFIDQTRQVPFPEYENHFRDIPVMVWYPAKNTEGCQPSFYGSRRAIEAEIDGAISYFPPEAGDLFRSLSQYREITTNSFSNAPIVAENALPTVFFTHGYLGTPWQNQIQFEHLASHGYVVISFGIPQEGHNEYPDGSFQPVSPEVYKGSFSEAEAKDVEKAAGILADRKNKSYAEIKEATQVLYDPKKHLTILLGRMEDWFKDFLFILNRVEDLNRSDSGSPFSGKLNLRKVGFFGMSMGGGLGSMIAYKKFPTNVAGTVSLDGAHYGIPYDAKIESPHMIVQSSESSRLLFELMEKDAYYITAHDTGHMNFSDASYVNPDGYRVLGMIKGIDPDQMVQIMNTCVLAFFDHYVRGLPNNIRQELSQLSGIEIEIK